jgi:hypothetical protein
MIESAVMSHLGCGRTIALAVRFRCLSSSTHGQKSHATNDTLICSRRYRLGSPRRRLIALRYRRHTPLPPRQHLPPFRMFCPKICPRRSGSFRIKSSIDRSPVLAEQKRRGGTLPESAENSRRLEPAAVSLPSGKLNAVRSAFKAGVKPSQIARQFGISQADVRKALARDGSKA